MKNKKIKHTRPRKYKIKKIISYKKVSQILNPLNPPSLDTTNKSTYDIKFTGTSYASVNDDAYGEKQNKGLRYNEGKPKWGLVHFKSLEPMVRVLEYGAKKYSPDNWKKGLDKKEILESMMRHIAALMDGEEIDPETGITHMGNIQCNAMFYNYFTALEDEYQ